MGAFVVGGTLLMLENICTYVSICYQISLLCHKAFTNVRRSGPDLSFFASRGACLAGGGEEAGGGA